MRASWEWACEHAPTLRPAQIRVWDAHHKTMKDDRLHEHENARRLEKSKTAGRSGIRRTER